MVSGLIAVGLRLAELTVFFELVLQVALLWLTWMTWRRTVGLGKTGCLQYRDHWYLVSHQQAAQIRHIRPGWVSPHLLTAELQCDSGSVSLVVPGDATSKAAHWALRRLVLAGAVDKVT